MCQDKNIESIIANVKKWVEEIQLRYDNRINAEIIVDETKVYRIILHINPYMAQIVIGEQDFAPYNKIGFEILEMKNGRINILYSWYDGEKDDINSIIEHLNIGFVKALSN